MPGPRADLQPAMTDDELDFFLGTPRHMGHLATVGRDGAPRVGPVWFAWKRPQLLVVTLTTTARYRHVQANPDVSLSVDAGAFPPTGAMLAGRAAVEPPNAEDLTAIVGRYLPPAPTTAYVQKYLADSERILLRVQCTTVYGWMGSKRSA
jgi:PPOX class probable F420-dependent enzyme